MKTATELYNKHFRGTDYEGQFEEALKEHDKEIKDLIDEMMPKEYTSKYIDEHWANAEVMQALAVRGALTELKNKI